MDHMKDRIGLGYAPLAALSPTPWGWIHPNGGIIADREEPELRAMANAGANCVRLLALAPWLQDGEINPAKVWAPYKVGSSGRFMLWVLEGSYFDSLWTIADDANKLGMTLWVDLFDHCGRNHPNSPWVTNEEGVSDYASTRADKYTKAYIREVAEALRGKDVIYGWGNEFRDRDETEFSLRVVAPTLAECGVPWEKQAYGADNLFREPCEQDFQKARLEDAYGLDAKLSVIRPVHGIGVDYSRAELIASWWGRNPIRKSLSDDGVFDGASVLDFQTDNPTRHRPSPAQWRTTIRRLRERQPSPTLDAPQLPGLWTWAFEHSPKQWQTEPTFLETQTETLSAMADEIEAWQGAPMANKGKVQINIAYIPPPPEPEPVPVIEYEYSWRFYKNWWNKIKALFGIIPPARRQKRK